MSRIIKHKIILYKLKNNDIVGEPNNGKYEMPKYKIEVSRVYCVEHIIEADDVDHAKEIGSEISEMMEANRETFIESNWSAHEVNSGNVTYTAEQDYLK